MTSRRLTVPDRLPPACSLIIAVFVLLLDYAVGPRIEFPNLFIGHGVCETCLKEQIVEWKRSG